MKEFRDTFEDGPDWNDGGPTVFRKGDIIVEGYLLIDELFDGENDIPSPTVILPDGTRPSFYDFDGWQSIEKSSTGE